MTYVDPLIGSRLGSFQIERLLGRGGMAKVYYGVDGNLQRPAAIKVIDERYRDDSSYAERFLREARAMAAWSHTHIPQIYQAGQVDGIYYYAMAFIPGMDLERLLRQYNQRGELPPVEDTLRVAKALAAALDYAHKKGAIHRDVKPANVLVAQDGRIFLTDFGLVMQVTRGTLGEVFGSPHYMSPEQALSSAQVVPQSDLYSLGVILYEMLTGRVPFDDPSPAALARMHIDQEPPNPRQINPALSPAVSSVLMKALRKSPAERYSTGRELVSALEEALSSESLVGTEVPGTLPYLISDPTSRTTPPQRTVSRLHLDQLASSQLEETPSPRAISGSASHAPPPPTSPTRRRASRWSNIGCAVLLVLISLPLLVGAVWAVSRPDGAGLPAAGRVSPTAELAVHETDTPPTLSVSQSATLTAAAAGQDPTPTLTPTPTATAASTASATPTRVYTATPRPTVTAKPSSTAAPTAIWQGIARIVLVKEKDDSFFLVNQSEVDLPLPLFRFGKGEGELNGEEWEVDWLEPGECVSVWKKEGNPKAPMGLRCDLVGERIERSGSEKFWTSTFRVYFLDKPVGTCDNDRDLCRIQFYSFLQRRRLLDQACPSLQDSQL